MANYNLTLAKIEQNNNVFALRQSGKFLNYTFDPYVAAAQNENLYTAVKRIDNGRHRRGGVRGLEAPDRYHRPLMARLGIKPCPA